MLHEKRRRDPGSATPEAEVRGQGQGKQQVRLNRCVVKVAQVIPGDGLGYKRELGINGRRYLRDQRDNPDPYNEC